MRLHKTQLKCWEINILRFAKIHYFDFNQAANSIYFLLILIFQGSVHLIKILLEKYFNTITIILYITSTFKQILHKYTKLELNVYCVM